MNNPRGIEKLYLIGLMGSGKSTVGNILAAAMGWTFLDIDHEIETFAGCDISSIFEEQGEDGFRDYESQILLQTADMDHAVISCGGGIVTRTENVEFLKDHFTIWLNVAPAEAAARLEHATDRPLLNECRDTLTKLNDLLHQREASYAESARVHVTSSGRTPEEVASKILKEIELSHD